MKIRFLGNKRKFKNEQIKMKGEKSMKLLEEKKLYRNLKCYIKIKVFF